MKWCLIIFSQMTLFIDFQSSDWHKIPLNAIFNITLKRLDHEWIPIDHDRFLPSLPTYCNIGKGIVYLMNATLLSTFVNKLFSILHKHLNHYCLWFSVVHTYGRCNLTRPSYGPWKRGKMRLWEDNIKTFARERESLWE